MLPVLAKAAHPWSCFYLPLPKYYQTDMRTSLILFALLALCNIGAAQYYEAGISVGAANYSGELTTNGFRPSEYNPAFGVFGRYNHSPRLAAKGSVTMTQLTGSDATSGKAKTMSRNLDFRSPLYEMALLGEFNITPFAIRNNQGAALYVTGGVSGFYFNPQTQFNGQWVNLQPLGTEGQGSAAAPGVNRYKRIALAIPFGGGVKLNVTDRVNLGLEVIVRRTFTDHLDDVSGNYPNLETLHEANPLAATLSYRAPQFYNEAMPNPGGTPRGNSAIKDYFMTAQLNLSFNLTHKQGLDFDPKYDIFKDPPPGLSMLMWDDVPRA